ncbi:hypothetical protein [Streptomyces sp. A012304]|uniref:hypothetical protein n=1 Tax=Streptomyces sp. A012304 TaxID=375446 RepID=UPI00222EE861|nr:hypothetical protein [Streptomyces sp. A012304]GKQ36405.1 hypothetical protein ALMP_29480 [Streptomyces sp. A012304]
MQERGLFRPEALSARAQPVNPPDRLEAELSGRRWPLVAVLACVLAGLAFAVSARVPSFANGSVVDSGASRVLAVFPDKDGALPQPRQPATLTSPQGSDVRLRVTRVQQVTDVAERDALGLPSGVQVPFVMVELAHSSSGSAPSGTVGQVRVRVAERSLLSTLVRGVLAGPGGGTR